MPKTIAILGTGLIGLSWSIVFARKGFKVNLWNPREKSLKEAQNKLSEQLREIQLKSNGAFTDNYSESIYFSSDLTEALNGAYFVQECLPEKEDLKIELFKQCDAICDSQVIIASSTSGIPMSKMVENLTHRNRYLVTHPMNPPHLIPIVEVVPSLWTDEQIVSNAFELMNLLGQTPVRIHKEIDGFALNRLQCALISESIALVQNGYIEPEDIDKILTDGLGMRWATMGPFACMDGNAPGGFKEYVEKYGTLMREGAKNLMVDQNWENPTIEKIESWRRQVIPQSNLPQLRQSRDKKLLALKSLQKKW